ncbi:MAG: hypothetical protein ACFWUE_04215 [Xylanivirga thermophila]
MQLDAGSGLPLQQGSRKRPAELRRGHLGRPDRGNPRRLQAAGREGIHHQLHLLKPDRNHCPLRGARMHAGRNRQDQRTLHPLRKRRPRPDPRLQDDHKGGMNHVERRNHRNPGRQGQNQVHGLPLLGQALRRAKRGLRPERRQDQQAHHQD